MRDASGVRVSGAVVVVESALGAVTPAKAGIQAVAADEAGDAMRHISGFQPSRE